MLCKQARLFSRAASAAGQHAESRVQEQEIKIRKLHYQIKQLRASEQQLQAQLDVSQSTQASALGLQVRDRS